MIDFIVNPNSQSGNGLKIWNKIERELKNKSIEYKVHFTEKPSHGTIIANNLTSRALKRTLIVLGGDGTVNEVINGIQHHEHITFGYIPTGSCNDLARGFNIPLKPLKALNKILDNQTTMKTIDNGCVHFEDGTSHNFASNGGFGLDAVICEKALNSKLKKFLNKINLGKLIYVFILLKQLVSFKPQEAYVTIDGEVYHYKKLYIAAFNNHPYEGGGMKMCPDASPYDQMVDLCIVNGISKLKILTMFLLIFSGKHTQLNGVTTFRGQEISIQMTHPLPVHTDGEIIGHHKEIIVKCAPSKLNFILPS